MKIDKFYTLFLIKLLKNKHNTIITLKSLLLIHEYTRKGPVETITENSMKALRAIHLIWKKIANECTENSLDPARS